MSRVLLGALCLLGALVMATTALAYWSAGGIGSGSSSTATMPTGATPSVAVSGRDVTVSFAQNAFADTTIGAAGGYYVVRRYAEGGTTPITPGAGCGADITGAAATLSCTEAAVPLGRWEYRVTPHYDSFVGTEGPRSAVAAVAPAAPTLGSVAAQNPAAGATDGPIVATWSAVTGATGYNVYRRVAGGSYSFTTPLNGATPVTGLTFSDTTATNSTTYDYVVRATAGPPAGESASSNELSAKVVTRPPAPAGAVSAVPGSGGKLTVSWAAVTDVAGYNVYRRTSTGAFTFSAPLNGVAPVTTTSYVDTNPVSGSAYVYVVRSVRTGAGSAQVESVNSAESASASCSDAFFQNPISASAPNNYFRLGEASGTVAVNAVTTTRNGVYGGGVTLGQPGAIRCSTNTAATFNGSTGYVGAASGTSSVAGPNIFTIEAWFKTSVGGGKLVGFGRSRTGSSTSFDRHVYLTNAGRVVFGVRPAGVVRTVASASSYIDDQWHMVTATLGAAGMVLYVDGVQVAADAATVSGESYNGYWRLGYDNLTGWGTTQPTNFFFTGTLDEIGVYPTQLSATDVAAHYAGDRP